MATEKSLDINVNTSDAQKNIDGLTASLGSLGASFVRMSAIIAGFTALNTLVSSFSSAISSAIRFEEQIAEIQKVTSRGVARQLEAEIERLASDIPIAREEIAGIVEEAGRLGIQGTKNISQFTETVSKIGVATNVTSKEAAKNFARILTVTGTATSKIEELGSVVNELSNNMATSADEIVGGMQRASATAAQFGLQAGEIAAVSASINEVSATARRANTRLRRLFQELQSPKKIEDVAGALSLTTNEFKNMKENSPVQLLLDLVKTFRRGKRGADQLKTALGSASRQAVAGLSQNVKGLNQALGINNSQMRSATSLQREYEIQAETTAAKIQRLKNNWQNLSTTVGEFFLQLEESLGLLSRTTAGFEGLTAAMEGRSKDFEGIVSKEDAEDLEKAVGLLDTFNTTAAQIAEKAGVEGAFISEDEIRRVQGFMQGALQEAPEQVRSNLSDAFGGSLRFASKRPAKRSAKEIIKLFNEDIKQLAPQLQDAGKELAKNIRDGAKDESPIPKDLRNFAKNVNEEIQTIGDLEAQIRKVERAEDVDLLSPKVAEKKKKKIREQINEIKNGTEEASKKGRRELTRFEQTAQRVSQGAAQSFQDNFVKAMQGGFDSVEDALRGFGKSFVQELQRIVASNAARQLFGQGQTEDGGFDFGLVGQGLNALGSFFSGDSGGTTTTGSPVSAANINSPVADGFISKNGQVTPIDSRDNVLAFRDNGPVMDSQGSGGGTTVNQEINVTTGVQQTVRAEIQRMMPQIQKAALEGVKESTKRGGSTSQTMGA